MNLVKRGLQKQIGSLLRPGKVLVLYGPRRVGKTTLLRLVAEELAEKPPFLNGEERLVKEVFSSHDSARIGGLIGPAKTVFLDEAQHIPDIGENLKLLVDTFPEVAVLATGSSSFDLAKKTGEPLTGRREVLTLYPLSQLELVENFGRAKVLAKLEETLLFGSYPEVVNLSGYEEKGHYLRNLAEAYLYRDALMLEDIRRPEKIFDLLRLLAFQIGQEVSLTELAGNLQLSRNTVWRYLDVLGKSFVLMNIRGFSRNLRSEVTKNSRYYFWDNGVRNAVISNFNLLNSRNDLGMLWENFLAIERIKAQNSWGQLANNYFWRTYEKQEIDWVEERGGRLLGFEFKWQKVVNQAPRLWRQTYPEASFRTVTKDNYLDFVTQTPA